MEIVKNNTVVKFAALAIGLAMVFSFAAPQAQAQSVEDLTAQINSLLTTIAALQSQLATLAGGGSTSSGSSVCPFAWTTSLSNGDQGPDVLALQKFLNSDPATQVAASGVGSAGSETDYFGGLTSGAVAAFQNLYAAQVLTPVGLTSGTGYFGPSTRAHINSLCTVATPPADDSSDDSADDSADDTSDSAVGTGVTIGTAAQPANSVAPLLAARVPFTTFSLTAGSDGPVTIDNVTVERTGFADNDVFAGIVLLGPSGEQLGDAKTLNSNNQAKVGTKYVIPAGQTHQFTIAGNMKSVAANNDGQVASLSLVSVNTSATVSGSLPVTGASHVINESLDIGAIEVSVGPTDRDSASLTEEVGTVNAILASLRITNNSSNEDVRLMSVRFEQNGSASNDDLENINLQIDGVTYQPVISGDFYRFDLGSGIVIAEGFNKEMTLRGDFPGGSGKTAQFDIDKDTDIYAVGETFGFGTIPTPDTTETPATGASEFVTGGSPFFSASLISISAGRVTNISKSSDVPSQNIAENVPNQPLGGFEVEVKGEPVTIQTMTYRLGVISGVANWSDVTNVSLVDANGAIVAGPVDAAAGGVVLFGDTVTLPVGMSTYSLKGKVSTDFANDDTISASTTPLTDWTSPEGENTGDAVTLPSATITGNTMTIKSASISMSVAPDPSAQTIVSGVSQFTMANVQFNGTQSGEDVRFSTASFFYTDGGSDPTNCKAFDGSTQLTDDTVNPSGTGADTYVFDQNLIVPKGTIKTVAIKCDVPGGSTGTFALGLSAATGSTTGTGLDSGSSVAALVTTGGPTMTLAAAGTLTITLDSSSPSLTLAAAGSNDVTLGVLNLRATNENIRVDKLALQLASTTASDSGDIGTINVYQGATLLGSATIEGTTATTTTVTLNQSTLTVPKDEDVEITIKANLSNISASAPGQAGALVGIDWDGNPLTSNNNRAIGEASGAEVTIAGSDTSVSGVRLFNSFPTVAKVSTTGDISNGTNRDLLRFSITADSADDVGIYGLSVTIATTTLDVVNVNIFAFTDSGFSSIASGVQTDGSLAASDQTPVLPGTALNFIAETQGGLTTALQIPNGLTRYFAVRGDVSGVADGDSVTTTLVGDSSAYDAGNLGVGTAVLVDTASNFTWSGNSDGESATSTVDFANGYQVPGLPANGLDELRGG